jgi:TRAP-type mannitol/chloroaromatic compound transport system permease small subunit
MKKLNDGLFQIASVCVAVVVGLVFSQVIWRYFFNDSSVALQELSWHLFGVIVVFAAAYGLHTDRHVRVDVFYGHWSARAQSIVNIIGAIVFIFPMCAILIWQGTEYVMQARTFMESGPETSLLGWFLAGEGSSTPGGLPARWLVKSLIPICGVSLLLQSFLEILINLDRIKERRT